jgi:hypothetical protein
VDWGLSSSPHSRVQEEREQGHGPWRPCRFDGGSGGERRSSQGGHGRAAWATPGHRRRQHGQAHGRWRASGQARPGAGAWPVTGGSGRAPGGRGRAKRGLGRLSHGRGRVERGLGRAAGEGRRRMPGRGMAWGGWSAPGDGRIGKGARRPGATGAWPQEGGGRLAGGRRAADGQRYGQYRNAPARNSWGKIVRRKNAPVDSSLQSNFIGNIVQTERSVYKVFRSISRSCPLRELTGGCMRFSWQKVKLCSNLIACRLF